MTKTYLDSLRDELTDAEARRDAAAAKLTDDGVYRELVLKQWEYNIMQIMARIRNEEQQKAATA
jgi:hypothetical protein